MAEHYERYRHFDIRLADTAREPYTSWLIKGEERVRVLRYGDEGRSGFETEVPALVAHYHGRNTAALAAKGTIHRRHETMRRLRELAEEAVRPKTKTKAKAEGKGKGGTSS